MNRYPASTARSCASAATIAGMDSLQARRLGVAIIGAGFGGLGLGARLAQRGQRNFRIFDKASGVGGTWWVNHYPGCACDVPSHLYSLSFAPNPDWTRRFAPRAEIQHYLQHLSERFDLDNHLELDCGIERATWNARERVWELHDSQGRDWRAEVLVSAMGGLSRPAWPEIEGLEDFTGPVFHSQQWDDSVDLTGKRVAVIGTGASAAQFVPEIAPKVAHLDVYQRSPHWILPRPDTAISPDTSKALPPTAAAPENGALRHLADFRGARAGPGLEHPAGRLSSLAGQTTSSPPGARPELRRKLQPDYDIGCKRVILSSDFYPTLTRDNVTLIDAGIRRIDTEAIICANGQRRPADVIILGTGFRATDPIPESMITGRDGIDLGKHWKKGPEAWRGVAVHGFPNLFMLLGPNTALGHNSVILMIEAQIEFVLRALDHRHRHGIDVLEIRGRAQREYNAWLHDKLAGTVWNSGGCSSWYLHPESGRNTTLWPGFTWQYARMMRRLEPGDFHLQ